MTNNQQPAVCVKCGHNNLREDGTCRECLNWYEDTYCNCTCVFPPAPIETFGQLMDAATAPQPEMKWNSLASPHEIIKELLDSLEGLLITFVWPRPVPLPDDIAETTKQAHIAVAEMNLELGRELLSDEAQDSAAPAPPAPQGEIDVVDDGLFAELCALFDERAAKLHKVGGSFTHQLALVAADFTRRKLANAAQQLLKHIEFIETPKIAAAGLSKEASAISAARVCADRLIDAPAPPEQATPQGESREHCGRPMRYEVIDDGAICDGQRLVGTYYCERCQVMQPIYIAAPTEPADSLLPSLEDLALEAATFLEESMGADAFRYNNQALHIAFALRESVNTRTSVPSSAAIDAQSIETAPRDPAIGDAQCLMADCEEIQSHFCVTHCLEVFCKKEGV